MNPLTNLKNLLGERLLREAKKEIIKGGKMPKKDEQGHQPQLELFESGEDSEEIGLLSTETNALQEFIKAEKNLEWLGFFTPSTNWTKEAKKKVISFTTVVEGKRIKASATILPSAEYGLPDTADLDKYRAFQKILSDELIRNGKVSKHITFTSSDLLEAMGKGRKGGEIYKEINDWLMRMKLTGVQSEGAVWLAGKKMWVTDTVNVFDRVVAFGRKLEDGTIADRHHIWLSDWMLENINGLYLLSIDYDLHKQLRKPIAKSLLPVLQIGFYASGGSYTKRYDDLCQHLGIKKRKRFSHIKQQLNPSFEDLRDKGFLANWDYDKNKLHKTYNIIWDAGDRFYEAQEMLKERGERLVEPVIKKRKRITRPKEKRTKARQPEVKANALLKLKAGETLKPSQNKETKPKSQTPEQLKYQAEPTTSETKEGSGLVEKLVAHNVTSSKAVELVQNHNPKTVEEWARAINYAEAHDKAAYLVKAIGENWALPEKYLRAKEQIAAEEKWQKQEQEKNEQRAEEMERKQQEAERLDDIYDSLSSEQQEEVAKEAEERLDNFSKKRLADGETDSPMVQGMLMVRKRDVVKEWLEAGKIEVAENETD